MKIYKIKCGISLIVEEHP